MPTIEPIYSDFNLDDYLELLHELCNKNESYITEYKCSFHETIRSNPFSRINPYINNTVEYGQYNDTRNKLLFGGEVDYITLPIYDILAYLAVWRLFNILNEVELIKFKELHPDLKINLDQNFGTKLILKLRRKDGSFDRQFETISSIKIFKEPIEYIKRFNEMNVLSSLYDRFKLFGIIDWIESIDNLDSYNDELQSSQFGKMQVEPLDITEFADSNCWVLSSIKQYCTYRAQKDQSGLYQYYAENLLNKDDSYITEFARNKLKDVMSFAYSIQFPILYNLRK